jgi:hypothetical protein
MGTLICTYAIAVLVVGVYTGWVFKSLPGISRQLEELESHIQNHTA